MKKKKKSSSHHRSPFIWPGNHLITTQGRIYHFQGWGERAAKHQLFIFFHSEPFKYLAITRSLCPILDFYVLGKWDPVLFLGSTRRRLFLFMLFDPHLPSWPYAAPFSGICHFNHSKNMASSAFNPLKCDLTNYPAQVSWDSSSSSRHGGYIHIKAHIFHMNCRLPHSELLQSMFSS